MQICRFGSSPQLFAALSPATWYVLPFALHLDQETNCFKQTANAPALAASVFVATGAVAYVGTGSVQQPLATLPTTTALVLALFTLAGGAIGSIRTRTPASFLVGHLFSPLYILAFVYLRAGRFPGAEIGMACSLVMGIGPALTGWDPLPKELAYLGVYGVVVFGHAVLGVGLLLCLLFAMVLVVYWEDVKQIKDRVDEAT